MNEFGIDYTAPGGLSIASAKHNVPPVKFVCRYSAPASRIYNWKRATASEVAALKKAGLEVVLVFETSANRALGGHAAGVADAQTAKAHAKEAGLAPTKVALYGGYWPVKRSIDAKITDGGWQTYAWSGGQLDRRVGLFQYSNGHKLAGVSCDYDKALKSDFAEYVYFAVDFDASAGQQNLINAYLQGAASVFKGAPAPKPKPPARKRQQLYEVVVGKWVIWTTPLKGAAQFFAHFMAHAVVRKKK